MKVGKEIAESIWGNQEVTDTPYKIPCSKESEQFGNQEVYPLDISNKQRT